MRKTIFICDKCGKEISETEASINEIYCHDFCEECALEAEKIIKKWIAKPKEEPKEEPIEETMEEPEPVIETSEKAKKPSKVCDAKKPNQMIDWDKACALKIAGWSNKAIAEEMNLNEGTVNSMIYGKVKLYKEGIRNGQEGI